jgi:ribosome-binding factor A
MKLRVVPLLRFHFDELQGYSRRLDGLIRKAVGDQPAVSDGSDSTDNSAVDGSVDGQNNPESNA